MAFEPAVWNRTPRLNLCACFSYALNAPGLGYANLGGVKQVIPAWRDENTIKDKNFIAKMAEQDGLIPVEERDFYPDKEHIIGIFTAADYQAMIGEYDYDCHHMRFDADGSVSDKPGSTTIRRFEIPPEKLASQFLSEVYAGDHQYSWFMGFYKFQGMDAHIRHPHFVKI